VSRAGKRFEEAGDPPRGMPPGRSVRLPGRGTTFVRELSGPPGAPTLLLLHGWVASGGLNWFQSFEALGRHFRVLAPDHRGHARGIRSWRPFRLKDCADDAAALMKELDTGPAIVAGYSMGGPIAQLLWHRHREQVRGLVLCATSCAMIPMTRHRVPFETAMTVAAGTTRMGQFSTALPRTIARSLLRRSPLSWPSTKRGWAANEFARHDLRMLLEAGAELSRFDARPWIRSVDVPTAVMVTRRDRAMDPEQQLETAHRIPKATVHPLEAGHLACASPEFAAPMSAACQDVAARSAA
jgi:pimeloyl-ACP methyl ester carboxylesterase